jgi:hypothetical protein
MVDKYEFMDETIAVIHLIFQTKEQQRCSIRDCGYQPLLILRAPGSCKNKQVTQAYVALILYG